MYETIVFSATYCKPCKPYKQMLKNNNIEFTELDVEDNLDMTQRHQIMSVPTTMIWKDDVLVAKFVGVVSLEEIKEVMQ